MKKQSTVLLDRMLAVIADVNARVAEREELDAVHGLRKFGICTQL